MTDLPNNPARIRPVEAAHIADLIRIGEETNLSPWSAESYLAEMKDPASIMLRLVSDENETIGFVVGRLVPGGSIEVKKDAEIYNIAVAKAFGRNGYGQQLLDSFLERCVAADAHNIWLEVRESNETAINFYQKNGFGLVQTRPNFYSNPRENALLMRLKLKSDKG